MLKTVVRSTAALALVASALALPATAGATEPAERFNAPGQRHVNVCVRLASPAAALRYGDASPTGFGLDDQRTFDDNLCLPGTVRLDLHELIPSPSGPLAFHRGGNGYNDDQNVKYGELATADVADALPAPVLARGGRGAPCDLAPGQASLVDVAPIPGDMKYKRPQDVPSGSNAGSSFLHYGDPAADQGDRHDVHYSYLLWSFVNVRGGGIVRTLLKQDQIVRPCDVAPITMDSWDRDGVVNGRVTARYVRVLAGSCPVYGWMVWSHDWFGDPGPQVDHTRAGGVPPADPAPDASCPVQENAQPPAVVTAGTTALGDSTATLGGTVDPAGTFASYHFEFGPGPDYGSATPETALGPDIAPLTVTAGLTGLLPGTAYHYRLVATNSHGTTYGGDAALTTLVPPPVDRVVDQPPPPPPPPPPPVVDLRDLRVSPAAFKRSRARGGSPARIRWTATAAATVTLTFERKTTGMRVGAACRPAPRAGLPRRARRCTRWVKVAGSLRPVVETGKTALPFGGWVGRRALARGSYRVRALPLGDDARVGAARYARFTLR